MRWVAVMLLIPMLAGCASSPVDETLDMVEETVAWVNPVNVTDDHDHSDLLSHDINNNITLIGHHALGPNGPPGGISEIDVAGGYAFLGVMGYGFLIVDIRNASAPELVASVEVTSPDQYSPATDVYLADLKVDAGGDWVFVALELSTTPGVLIYDARDKANPVLAGFWPEPGLLLGCHMIEYAQIGDNEYVFCAPLDNAIYVGQLLPPIGQTREIVQIARWMPHTPKFFEQQGNAVQSRIENCGVPPANPACYAGAATHFVSGHQDMTHQVDPLTGADMLVVSFWNLGLRFVDVSIPAAPIEIGSWQGERSEKFKGVLHTSMMFEHEGRRIAVTIPEGASIPAMFVLDATDLDTPEILAEWTAVEDFNGQGGRFSLHNFQIIDGKVYLAHYHGGIWVLDISTEERQKDPYALGTFMPWDRDVTFDEDGKASKPHGCCGGSWDVVVHEGYIITANNGGIYLAHLDGDETGEFGATSFA